MSVLSNNGCVSDSLSLRSTFEIFSCGSQRCNSRQNRQVGMATQENLVVNQHMCVGTGVRTFLGYFSPEGHVPSHLEWVSRLVRGSVSLSVVSAGTTTARWDLGSASLAVCRSVSLFLSFCLVVLLGLVLSFCLVCLPCLSCLSVSVCQSVWCVVCGACACEHDSPRLHEPLLFTPPFASPRPPHLPSRRCRRIG